jgi:hypothetical protein
MPAPDDAISAAITASASSVSETMALTPQQRLALKNNIGLVVPQESDLLEPAPQQNPIFTWVRLAQRVPVRIKIDRIPDGVRLVEGRP